MPGANSISLLGIMLKVSSITVSDTVNVFCFRFEYDCEKPETTKDINNMDITSLFSLLSLKRLR